MKRHVDFTKLATWLWGLLGAAISAAGSSLAGLGISMAIPHFNWAQFWLNVGVSSLVAGGLFMKGAPLPDIFDENDLTNFRNLPPPPPTKDPVP